MTKRLSKSKILLGLQCEKRLWLEIHRPELIAYSDDAQQRFAVGHQVNEVAHRLHGGGILIDGEQGMAAALAETRRVLRATPNRPVFEATFKHNNVLIRADILRKQRAAYRLIEVKSSTSVKAYYYPDCAVQAWVVEGAGLSLGKIELAHINNQFVYTGDGHYEGLLHYEDLTRDIRALKKDVPLWVRRFKQVLKGREPSITTGDHCTTPYSCPFIDYCSGDGPDYPVSCLPRGKKVAGELIEEGITDIRDIPAGRLANPTREWVRRVTIKGKAELRPAAKAIVSAYSCPRYYLDFETTAFAVPIWKGTRPYQALPFQWSCHIESAPGKFEHQAFLDTSGAPPMRSFVESLIRTLRKRGSIFVYSAFEASRLNELARRFPDLATPIEKIIARLVDLLPITRLHYYHPDMLGSWSIKAVLPTVAPSLDYSDLGEIRQGGAAEAAYQEIIHPQTEEARRKALATDLLAYCKRDTEALIALLHFLSTGRRKKRFTF